MEEKKHQGIQPTFITTIIQNKIGIIVHLMRILVKIGISVVLFLSHNPSAFFLTVWLLMSEILDQISLLLLRKKPQFKIIVEIFYVLNSFVVISAVAYFAKWTLNDFYLVYLIHISSSTLAYGFRVGLFSFVLSMIGYSTLLVMNNAALETYIRLPLLSILVLRYAASQGKYEAASGTLNNVLTVEKSKQDFIAIASHNLRTPVAAIYGYIEVLMRGGAGPLNNDQKTYIQRIKGNNQELEKLTEQLLQIAILQVGKEVNLLKQPSQIEVVVHDVVDKFMAIASTKGLTLNFDKQSGFMPLVDIDVEKIKSVLVNLIDNALKYTEKGGVTVTVGQEGEFVVVAVKDTGIGITEEELPKIFTKFYRSGNILVYNRIGIGLGLYLGKQIIELHGGQMTVKSVAGQGSTFSFTIPVAKQDSI
ncbi:HAMP domain-containing histidine kinase [Patescibacteria group bacterium]|nr:HAMP domain-containing histidine kinase [Patescibacteria group bacterium]